MKSWYAICENGGTDREVIKAERYVTKREAWAIIEVLEMTEQEDIEDNPWYDLDDLTKWDVVRVFEDGTITTEC